MSTETLFGLCDGAFSNSGERCARDTALMRYIGNKTRLLPFILRVLKKSGIAVGPAHDAFAGTASVSRGRQEGGWRVHSSDLLMSSYVFQRAYVVADSASSDIEARAKHLSAMPAG